MNAFMEKWYPHVFGGLVTIGFLVFHHHVTLPASTKDLFSAVITISAIAVGFLATAKSIMLSMDKKRVIRQLKEIGQYDTILQYLMSAVHWAFACSILSACALLVDCKEQPCWFPWAFAVWLFVTTTTATSCYRVIRIFHKILRSGD